MSGHRTRKKPETQESSNSRMHLQTAAPTKLFSNPSFEQMGAIRSGASGYVATVRELLDRARQAEAGYLIRSENYARGFEDGREPYPTGCSQDRWIWFDEKRNRFSGTTATWFWPNDLKKVRVNQIKLSQLGLDTELVLRLRANGIKTVKDLAGTAIDRLFSKTVIVAEELTILEHRLRHIGLLCPFSLRRRDANRLRKPERLQNKPNKKPGK